MVATINGEAPLYERPKLYPSPHMGGQLSSIGSFSSRPWASPADRPQCFPSPFWFREVMAAGHVKVPPAGRRKGRIKGGSSQSLQNLTEADDQYDCHTSMRSSTCRQTTDRDRHARAPPVMQRRAGLALAATTFAPRPASTQTMQGAAATSLTTQAVGTFWRSCWPSA